MKRELVEKMLARLREERSSIVLRDSVSEHVLRTAIVSGRTFVDEESQPPTCYVVLPRTSEPADFEALEPWSRPSIARCLLFGAGSARLAPDEHVDFEVDFDVISPTDVVLIEQLFFPSSLLSVFLERVTLDQEVLFDCEVSPMGPIPTTVFQAGSDTDFWSEIGLTKKKLARGTSIRLTLHNAGRRPADVVIGGKGHVEKKRRRRKDAGKKS